MARSAQSEKCEPRRQCAVTRVRRPCHELLRFALDPEGHAVADLKARLPGRGVWLTCTRDVVEKAATGGIFSKAFRQTVKTGDNLPAQVDSLLQRDALQRLSLANKAGLVVCGFDKIEKVLRGDGEAYVLHASDAAAGGCAKLDRLAGGRANALQSAVAVLCNFNAEQLSLALGRENVVHAALKQGVARDKFVYAMARLEKFRAGGTLYAAA